MADLTSETLAAWRKDAGCTTYGAMTGHGPELSKAKTRILALLDALAEAERALSSALEASECNHLAKIEWFHRAEKAEAALALTLNQQVEAERKYADLRAGVLRVADEFDSFGDYRTGDELRALDVKEEK